MIAYLAIVVAVLLALGVVAAAASKIERSRGNTKLADELDAAHEALDVVAGVLDGHEHGATIAQAAVQAESSPEAQDLLKKVLQKVGG